ncbi:MAG TPA: DUF2939 domain-containing protein [Longimicrobiaceae bacterium]|nr:DUF2939 domain-containing protein [Longimicrobiaceae bacterium]
MKKRFSFGPFLFLAVLFAGVWFYFSPYLALRKLQTAAEAGDTATLNELVDFPALRASVKQGVSTAVAREIDDEGNPLAAIGGFLAGRLASPVVDVAVSPEGIAALTRGDPRGGGEGGRPRVDAPELEAKRRYESLDRFVVHFVEEDSGKERLALVMQREGIAGWKLVGVRLPEERR